MSVRPIRVLSMFLLVVIANAYVFAGGAMSAPGNTSEAGNAKVLLGRLITNNNRPIIVNGGEAITGAIILSGTQLVTPAAAGANVQLENLGTVSIAPGSTVTLSFDQKNVTVNVATGYASVATVEGVKGTVLGLPNAGGNNVPTPAGGNSAKNWGIAGVAVGSAAFIWAIIAWNRANNARDSAAAAAAANAALAAQLAALRTCLAGQTASPVKICTSF
ncbi:MAG TPA: hypothetical protein VK557_15645 [Pyrinomonadaceae bacterium]|nr:hypothetical protein [Pyrinomonadaceae bacterium]